MLNKAVREGQQTAGDFESKFKLAEIRMKEIELECDMIKAEKRAAIE
jgi:hypothetical protein